MFNIAFGVLYTNNPQQLALRLSRHDNGMSFRHSDGKARKDNFGMLLYRRIKKNNQQDMCLPRKHCWFLIEDIYKESKCTCYCLLYDCIICYNFIYIPFLWRKPAKRPQNKISIITKASVPHFSECNIFCIKASLASTCA